MLNTGGQLTEPNFEIQELQDEPFPLLDYLQLLWFRRRLIIVITILAAVIGYIQVNQLRNVYTATSSILVGVRQAQPTDFNNYIRSYYDVQDSNEEVEILKSRGIAERVVVKLKLLNHPEFNPALAERKEGFFDFLTYLNPMNWVPDLVKSIIHEAKTGEVVAIQPSAEELERRKMVTAVDIFVGRIRAAPVKYSDVISVSFKSFDPRIAARVANEIPEAYIVDQLESKFAATQKVTNWLTDQLNELKEKVAESERAVEIYRIEHDLTETAGTGLLAEQISEINSQMIIARASRAEAEVRLEQMNRLLEQSRQGLETTVDVLDSSLIQSLRSQEAAIMNRRSELAVEYGPKHPRMLQVNAEIDDINRRIDQEMDKITVGLENEVERARLREASFVKSLAQLESETGFQNTDSIRLRALEREAESDKALFENFLLRFKETSSTQGMDSPDARVLSNAEVPRAPSEPNRRRLFVLYVLSGFIGACGLVLGLQFLNPGMQTPEQVEHDLGIRVMGMIPKIASKKTQPHEYMLEKPKSGYVEAINSVRVALRLSDPDRKAKSIQITSSVPAEGKSSLALTLSIALARSGSRVALVDADLRRATIEKRFGLTAKVPGLTDFVMSESDQVSDFLTHDERTGIDFMRSGDAKFASATDIFNSQRIKTIIELMEKEFDYIFFDTPPVMAVADARVIGTVVDKTLFVVRWDKTPKKVARAAISLLRQGGTEIDGLILQQVDLKRYGRIGWGDSGYYYNYGRYGQYYSS